MCVYFYKICSIKHILFKYIYIWKYMSLVGYQVCRNIASTTHLTSESLLQRPWHLIFFFFLLVPTKRLELPTSTLWVWVLAPDLALKTYNYCLLSCHPFPSCVYSHVFIEIKNFLQCFFPAHGSPEHAASWTVNLVNINSRFSSHERVHEPWC